MNIYLFRLEATILSYLIPRVLSPSRVFDNVCPGYVMDEREYDG